MDDAGWVNGIELQCHSTYHGLVSMSETVKLLCVIHLTDIRYHTNLCVQLNCVDLCSEFIMSRRRSAKGISSSENSYEVLCIQLGCLQVLLIANVIIKIVLCGYDAFSS